MYLVPQMSVLKWLGNSSGFKVNINYYDKFFLYASMFSGLSTTVLNTLSRADPKVTIKKFPCPQPKLDNIIITNTSTG